MKNFVPTTIEELWNGLQGKFEGIDRRFDRLESRLDGVDDRLDLVAATVQQHSEQLDRIEISVARLQLKHS